MKKKTDEQIETEFNKLIMEDLTDKEFNSYVFEWYDVDNILDIMDNWDIDVKKDTIKELKNIIKRRKKRQKNQFNIFDYLDVKTLAEDLGLDVDDSNWILEKEDDRGTFSVFEEK